MVIARAKKLRLTKVMIAENCTMGANAIQYRYHLFAFGKCAD